MNPNCKRQKFVELLNENLDKCSVIDHLHSIISRGAEEIERRRLSLKCRAKVTNVALYITAYV